MKKFIIFVSIVAILLSADKIYGAFGDEGAFGSVVNYLKRVATNIIPSINNTYDLGSLTKKWKNIYGTVLNINSSADMQELTVGGDMTLTDANPNIVFRDSTDNTAYCFHLESAASAAPYQNFQLWRGTDIGGLNSFAVNPDVPLMWFDNTNNVHFSNDLIITGTISGANVTSGADPGHTHTGSSISGIDISTDTNLSGDTENVLTGDVLSIGAGITRDTEWDTLAEINTASTDADILQFQTISVATQTNVVAEAIADTLTLVGAGITAITTNATTDTITFTSTEVDGSTTNEINTIQGDDNVATTGLAISIDGAGIVTTDVVGDVLTITGTEVDGSTTNEINTLTLPDANVTAGVGITFAQAGSLAITESIADTVLFTVTETDPNALLTAGTDNVKDTHIDFGTGASQVSASDMPNEDIGDITITTGVYAVEDDSHAHTGTSLSAIDISSDTNLTAGDHITLTDDDLDIDDDFLLNSGDTGTGAYNFQSAVPQITLGKDETTPTVNIIGQIKMFGSGDTAYYSTLSAGANTSNAAYILPLDEPAGTYLLNMTTAGQIGYDSSTYLTSEVDGSITNELPIAGNLIDISGSPASTVDVDLTEAESVTWGAGAAATIVHTFNVSGTDTTMTMGSAATTFSGTVAGSNLSGTNTGDNTVATTGDSATAFFSAGTIEHEYGGLEANVSAYNGFVKISGGATSAVTANAGTDITADLEEETHASEHAVSAADTVFPADPNADKYLMWDDDPGVFVFADAVGSGDITSIGDVADGAAFDGTQGTTLTFNNVGGDGTLDYDGTDFSISHPITVTGLLNTSVGIDGVGAVDMDYGSADITDHTFTSDGGTVILDGNINSSTLTVSEILITDASKNIVSAAVATYPSLTELSYVKGLSSAIQTQINGKQATVTEGSLADSVIVSADIKNGEIVSADLSATAGITLAQTAMTAGRSLTISTNDVAADAELYTDTKGIWFENPVATDDFKSIWTANGFACTITKIWAESDQTVTFMLQVDDGTPADVDSVDLAPAAGTAEDEALDGDTTMADGDRLDLAITSVANTPTWVSIQWTYTKDD